MLYLTRWRLDCARQWLGESRDSIGEIADRVGYKSEAAFARAFKRHFGMGPGAARRDARG
jgi:AraC-like DNA-binding protein